MAVITRIFVQPLSPQKGSSRDHETRASDTCRYWKKNVLRADVSPSRIVDHAEGTQSPKIIGIGAALRRDIDTLGKRFFGDGLRVEGHDLAENPCLGTGDDLRPCLMQIAHGRRGGDGARAALSGYREGHAAGLRVVDEAERAQPPKI